MDGIPVGAVTLYFLPARHRPNRVDLRFTRAGEIQESNLQLANANILSGTVTDESSVPLSHAHVTAGNELGSTTETDESGTFTIYRLGDLPVQVSAGAKGFGTVYIRDVPPNKTDLVIRLPRSGSVLGRVLADPLPDWCEIKLLRYDEHFQKELLVKGFRMNCRGDAAFRVEEVSPGAYTVKAEAPGYELETPATIRVERGEATGPIELRLRKK
jgi:hypothetical protein